MKKKIFILGILLLIMVSSVSAELAYKTYFKLIDGNPEVVYTTVIDVSSDEIVRPIIGKYLLVASDGTNMVDIEGKPTYLDGVFFNLPAVTFVTYADAEGGLYTETIEEDETVVYIPYQEEIIEFKGFISDGTEVLNFPAPKEGEIKKFRELSPEIEEKIGVVSNIPSGEEIAEQVLGSSEKTSEGDKQTKNAYLFVLIAVIVIIVVFVFKKMLRKE